MRYTFEDIATQIAPETLDRGRHWFSEGKVTAPNIQRDGEILTAIIPHGGGRPLRLYVRTEKVRGAVRISGDCSCPKRHNCEHVAAVLLQALKDRQALPERLPSAPRRSNRPILGARQPSSLNNRAPSHVLIYLLHVGGSGVSVEPKVARHLKRGGFTVGGHFDPRKASPHTPARFLQPVDQELLTELEQLPSVARSGFELSNERQPDCLLGKLLDTGRCGLLGVGRVNPLRLGAARPLTLEWRVDEFGWQHLVSQTTPDSERLLPLLSPWYLDREAGECGEVQCSLSRALLDELLHLPAVSPDHAQSVYNALAKTYPGEPIPRLRVFEADRAAKVQPVPCLCLGTRHDEHFREPQDYARLRFDYGGIELNPDDPDTRLVGSRVIWMPRDRSAEKAAQQHLHTLGLEERQQQPAEPGSTYLVPSVHSGVSEAEAWLGFQADHLPALRDQGWRITYEHFRHHLAEATRWLCEIDSLQRRDWFSVGLGVEVEGQRLDLLPILLEALRRFPRGELEQATISAEQIVVRFNNEHGQTRLVRLPMERLYPLLHTLLEIHDGTDSLEIDALRLNRVQLARLSALDTEAGHAQGAPLHWLGNDDARDLVSRLRDLEGIPQANPPEGLSAVLRPYQQQGLSWLQFLREYRLAGILADDMGLGKTLQALAHLLLEKESGRADRPSLVVAPTTLMFNWRREAQRFAPQLRVLVLQGPHRKSDFSSIAEHDLVITTYPLLARDQRALLAEKYHLLILDEAQMIKNNKAQASHVARKIEARHRLCLTGTPMENHLGELWSLFDFLLPGLLGDSKRFRRLFRTPIEQHASETVAQHLSRRIRPFLLRRTKAQVAAELPEKIEVVQRVALEGRQRELYETVRLAMHHRVRAEIARQGLARSQVVVLDALLKLRQVCCDPRLVASEQARGVNVSGKLEVLMQLLPEMVEEGRRILLFSQFTSMLSLIEEAVKRAGIDYVKLTGRSRDRERTVQRFQAGGVPLFLISLKAGGVGLNLTAADAVIHYDPWWNPAVERQATDRAHRIGQRQTVLVYKLICEGTVEEKIQAMQQRKQALADGLYQRGDEEGPQWSAEDLDELFGPLPDSVES